MQIENIRKFLATNYGDEKLAALLVHAESGRLGWNSCCCLVGIATATHTLQTATAFGEMRGSCPGDSHLQEARRLPYAAEAENEFLHIAWSDAGRRERLLPLIREEMERRERSEIAVIGRKSPLWPLGDGPSQLPDRVLDGVDDMDDVDDMDNLADGLSTDQRDVFYIDCETL